MLSHLKIREATPADNVGLIELTSQSPMQGIISLRIDRHPDFFSLLNERGKGAVLVATIDDKIIGSFSSAMKNVWLDGEKTRVHYLADLKVLPAYRGSQAAIRLVKKMYASIQSQQADLLYCTTAKGNEKILPFFDGRLGIPAFISLGEFSVHQILPTPVKIKKKIPYEITDQFPEGFQLHQFYNEFYRNYQLAPVIGEADLAKTTHIFAIQNGKVKAVMSLLNAHSLKQNVVVDMPVFLKILVPISKITSKLFGLFRLPSRGESIRTLHIKYFACENHHAQALQYLLQRARNIGWEQKFHFVSLGLHQKDPYQSFFKSAPKISFSSIGLATSIKGNKEKLNHIAAGIPYEDFSLS